jgi:hypothetical protein
MAGLFYKTVDFYIYDMTTISMVQKSGKLSEQLEIYLENMKNSLMKPENWKDVILSGDLSTEYPSEQGVIAAFESGNLVYIGETGNIRGWVKDLRSSFNNTLRRNLGDYNFQTVVGYKKASDREKFPSHIENKVDSWLTEKIKISILATDLGRKELKERLIEELNPKYNKKGKRKEN